MVDSFRTAETLPNLLINYIYKSFIMENLTIEHNLMVYFLMLYIRMVN